MKKGLLAILALFTVVYSYSQGEVDAFRASRNDLQGTARVQSMGGAFGALGGDIGGITINPAGIGVYRSSEISATMALSNIKITTNGIDDQGKTKFNFDNISYVGYFPTGGDNLLSLNFGFTYNRLKNFNRNYTANNSGRATSLSDYMAAVSDGYLNSALESNNRYNSGIPWLSILGWNAFLMDEYVDRNGVVHDDAYQSILEENEPVDSRIKSSERGAIESYDFTIGGNVADKLYLGLTASLTDISYQMYSTYRENFTRNDGLVLDNFLETSGSGYQVKLGAIYRPVDQLRLGISYHSPTWYSLTDYYQATATPIGFGEGPESTPDGAWSYKMQTPYSWMFSAAAVLGANAIVSLDYEIKDYTTMNLKESDGYNLEKDNQFIDEDFKIASSLRLGLEYKFTPQFAGRIGYAWMGSPYETNFKNGNTQVMTAGTVPQYTVEGDVNYFTAGLGYRFTPKFYLDLAIVARTQTDDLYYFSPIPSWDLKSQSVEYKNKTIKGLLTVGYKF